MSERRYVPALAYHTLTPIYDAFLANVLREDAWKSAFLRQIAPAGGERILDIGCGTGTLTLRMKAIAPRAEVMGLDPDPAMLKRARRKASEGGFDVRFLEGFADNPPEELASAQEAFDKVTSSLMLHHLPREAKLSAFANAHRLLRPGGELHVVDWGRAADTFQRAMFYWTQILDGFEATRDNIAGRLPDMMREADFEDVAETQYLRTLAGTLRFHRARRSDCRV